MSDFSLTLVLQIKTSKIINDMAKVQIKKEIKKNFARKSSSNKKSPKIFGTFNYTSYLCTVRTSVLAIRVESRVG
jgi:hypothetical protein